MGVKEKPTQNWNCPYQGIFFLIILETRKYHTTLESSDTYQ